METKQSTYRLRPPITSRLARGLIRQTARVPSTSFGGREIDDDDDFAPGVLERRRRDGGNQRPAPV